MALTTAAPSFSLTTKLMFGSEHLCDHAGVYTSFSDGLEDF
jgi:hypothetical protein